MSANMTERIALRWQPISYELYCAIFKELGDGTMGNDSRKWGAFTTYTSGNEDGDQMTEWGLRVADESLLKNESRRGVYSYFLAVPR